ncbi:MAG: FKBP-type peptidyl-prolyl cis-trans isomerase [Clostridiales bacterium]|nr:FKBP-type peptidyl-prolyl cis-trans isomerase [Clostridiales bacterium]
MKKILLIIPSLIAVLTLLTQTSCGESNDTWNDYALWRETNSNWLLDQGALLDDDGQAFYTRVVPQWNSSAYVYMHYFNDRSLTEGNLTPLYNSTVAVKYIGRLYNQEPFDSSYRAVDSLFVTQLGNVVSGWGIALQNMRVGDSARVVIPYEQGYGASSMGSIPPYSVLQFDIKLVDIPYYEAKP